MTTLTRASTAEAIHRRPTKTITMAIRVTSPHIPGVICVWFCCRLHFNHKNTIFMSFRSPSANPSLTKTKYYYKTHQSATVSIPKHNHHHHNRYRRIPVGPDENETHSYVTRVDTTHVGPRKPRRYRDDDESEQHLKPFFRTGEIFYDIFI